jgi:hypothetical protein
MGSDSDESDPDSAIDTALGGQAVGVHHASGAQNAITIPIAAAPIHRSEPPLRGADRLKPSHEILTRAQCRAAYRSKATRKSAPPADPSAEITSNGNARQNGSD